MKCQYNCYPLSKRYLFFSKKLQIKNSGFVKTCDEHVPCRGRLVALLFRLSKNFIRGMVPPPRIMVVKSTTTNVVVTKTFRVSSLNSIIEPTTCFHEFSEYESTNFFTNICQMEKQTNCLLVKRGIFSQF